MKSYLNTIFTPRFLFISIVILIAALSRLLPHPYNFTPIGAIALFGGACLANKKLAFIVPLLAMALSDFAFHFVAGIGWHNTILYVYASFILITFIGIYLGKRKTTGNIIAASLFSSLLFFLVTNFGVWAAGDFYLGLNGLLAVYFAGIPFYNNEIFGSFLFNTIAGDIFYNTLLFGLLYFAQLKFPVFTKA